MVEGGDTPSMKHRAGPGLEGSSGRAYSTSGWEAGSVWLGERGGVGEYRAAGREPLQPAHEIPARGRGRAVGTQTG